MGVLMILTYIIICVGTYTYMDNSILQFEFINIAIFLPFTGSPYLNIGLLRTKLHDLI